MFVQLNLQLLEQSEILLVGQAHHQQHCRLAWDLALVALDFFAILVTATRFDDSQCLDIVGIVVDHRVDADRPLPRARS